jgi:hypothetical protein
MFNKFSMLPGYEYSTSRILNLDSHTVNYLDLLEYNVYTKFNILSNVQL